MNSDSKHPSAFIFAIIVSLSASFLFAKSDTEPTERTRPSDNSKTRNFRFIYLYESANSSTDQTIKQHCVQEILVNELKPEQLQRANTVAVGKLETRLNFVAVDDSKCSNFEKSFNPIGLFGKKGTLSVSELSPSASTNFYDQFFARSLTPKNKTGQSKGTLSGAKAKSLIAEGLYDLSQQKKVKNQQTGSP